MIGFTYIYINHYDENLLNIFLICFLKSSDKKDFTVTTDDKKRCSAGGKKDSKDELLTAVDHEGEQRVEETRGDSEENKENEYPEDSDKNTITSQKNRERV